jgi:hypothetical protein
MITVVNVKGVNRAADRATICYVGRAFAGWPASPLGNPFKGPDAVAQYARWLTHHPDRLALLTVVWETCNHGSKPLGCWCMPRPWAVDRTCLPTCHAQVVAVQLLDLVETGVFSGTHS